MSEKEKILFMLPSLGRGGLERAALRFASMLEGEYEPYFTVMETREDEYPCPFPLFRSPIIERGLYQIQKMSKFLPFKAVQVLINYALIADYFIRRRAYIRQYRKEHRFRYVFSFGSAVNDLNVRTRCGERLLLSVHSYVDLSLPKEKIEKLAGSYRKADAVFAVSDLIREGLIREYRLPPDRCHTLYNPSDSSAITAAAEKDTDFSPAHPAVLAFGRLHEVKGCFMLLHSFREALQKAPQAHLYFVGEGPLRAELEDTAQKLGIAESVTFCGLKSDPFPYVKRCDIYVLSSFNEGLPNAMIEAMICGLPVVSCDCKSGPREILAPGTEGTAEGIEYAEYGILTPPFDKDLPPEAQPHAVGCLADAISELAGDREKRADYAARGNRRAKDFSEDNIRETLREILRRIG